MNSSSTSSTDADERLPTRRRVCHETSSAPSGRSKDCAVASSTLGPPVCMIHVSISPLRRSDLVQLTLSFSVRQLLFLHSFRSLTHARHVPEGIYWHPPNPARPADCRLRQPPGPYCSNKHD